MKQSKLFFSIFLLFPLIFSACIPQNQPPEQPEQNTELENPEQNQETEVNTPGEENLQLEQPEESTSEPEEPIESIQEPVPPEEEIKMDEPEEDIIPDNQETEPDLSDVEEIIPETVCFSLEGSVPYETKLELLCSSENCKIYYSFTEFSPENFNDQILYKEPILITKDCSIFAVAVISNLYSEINSAAFFISNVEELIFGKALIYTTSDLEEISIASNEKNVTTNNLGAIIGTDVQISITKNDATQPENWNDSWRLYYTSAENKKSNTMEIFSPERKIIKILFESNNYTAGKFESDVGTFDTDSKCWTGCENKIVFTPTKNARLTKILLVYESYLN